MGLRITLRVLVRLVFGYMKAYPFNHKAQSKLVCSATITMT